VEPKPTLVFDEWLKVSAASAACAPLLGVPADALVGMQCRDVLGCPTCLGDACPLRQARAGEAAEGILPSVGGGLPLAVSSAPLTTGAGAGRLTIVHLRRDDSRHDALGAGLQAVLDGLRELLQSDMAALALYDESIKEVHWQVTSGSVGDVTRIRLRPGQGFAGRIVMTDLPLRTFRFPQDLTADPGSYPIFLAEGLTSALGVPLRGKDRVLGVLMVANRTERQYSDEDLAKLMGVAGSISLAAEMICLYGEALRQERSKLAQEVHDGLSQNLFGLKLLLFDLQQGLRDGPPHMVQSGISEICGLLDTTLVEVRRLITDLRGSSGTGVGLVSALSDQLAGFYRLSQLQVELAVRLAPGHEVHCRDVHEVLRIVQEALMNVYRHARATHVWVEVAPEEGAYRLTIADDGKGYDPHEAAPQGHYGLAIMRERAHRLKAELRVQSAPGQGTAVVLRIPV